jgi:hypothetical protein
MRYDETTNTVYYRKGCDWKVLPVGAQIGGGTGGTGGVPIGGGSPVPPSDPDAPETTDNACFKANGAWTAIENFIEATFPIIDDYFNAIPILGPTTSYIKFQRTHPEIDEDNANTLAYFVLATGMGVDGIRGVLGSGGVINHWNEHRDSIRDDFICAMQDKFDKTDRLSDKDYKAVNDYEFQVPSSPLSFTQANLKTLLAGAVNSLEKAYFQKLAYAAVTTQIGTCNCSGASPTNPDDYTEPTTPGYWLSPVVMEVSGSSDGTGWHRMNMETIAKYDVYAVVSDIIQEGDGGWADPDGTFGPFDTGDSAAATGEWRSCIKHHDVTGSRPEWISISGNSTIQDSLYYDWWVAEESGIGGDLQFNAPIDEVIPAGTKIAQQFLFGFGQTQQAKARIRFVHKKV